MNRAWKALALSMSLVAVPFTGCYEQPPEPRAPVAYVPTLIIVPLPTEAQAPATPHASRAQGRPPSERARNELGPVSTAMKGQIYFLDAGTRQLPDFRVLDPVAAVELHELNIPQRPAEFGFPGVNGRIEWFGARFDAVFRVETAGSYAFRVVSDDGSRLLIDGKTVLINDGTHMATSSTGSVIMTEGKHRVEVEYFQGPRLDIALQFFWTPPGQTEQIFTVGS